MHKDTQHNNTAIMFKSFIFYCYAECQAAEYRYSERHCAECHHAKCRVPSTLVTGPNNVNKTH